MPISRTAVFVCLLLAAVAALYGQFLWNPILFDDTSPFLLDNEGNQPISNFRFSLLEIRSLPYATLAWTKAWFGLELIYFRLGNLLLHATAVLTLYFFLAKLFTALYDNHGAEGLSPQLAAFFAALLFALHPVAVYAAGYLVQRSIIMATLFGLLAMLAYVHGSIRQKQLWLWMSVPCYFLAVFSKEHAIMLPFTLLALTVLLHYDWTEKLKQRWAIFSAFAAIGLFVLFVRRGWLGSVYEIGAPEMMQQNGYALAYPLSVLTQSWLFFKYALLWLIPNPAWMSVDMREPFAQSLFSPYLVAALCFIAWGAGAFWLLLKRERMGLAGLAMLFPWLMFFTEFSSVRMQEVFVLYRSYLWAVGAVCLLPLLFAKVKTRLAVVVLTIIALVMFAISMERLTTFSHPVLLWDDAEKLVKDHVDLPGAYRIYFNRGIALNKIDQTDHAIADFKQAITLKQNAVEAHGNLGAAYYKKGEWQNAAAAFGQAIEIARGENKYLDPRFVYGRAHAFDKLGDQQKAHADFKESCLLGISQACAK